MDHVEINDRPWLKFYEPSVPTSFPETCTLCGDGDDGPASSLWEQFERTAHAWPDSIAIVFEGTSLTYRQLKALTDQFAVALCRLGVKHGDRVVINLPNLPQTVISYYAVHRIGAIAVMANPMYVTPELAHTFADSGAAAVITLDAYWVHKIRRIKTSTALRAVIVTSIADYLPFPKKQIFPIIGKRKGVWEKVRREQGVYRFLDMVEPEEKWPDPAELPANPGGPDDPACLQYTGGTTGISKGAVLTHRNLISNVHQICVWFPGLQPGKEIFMCALPFFHVFGMTVCLNTAISIGACMVLVTDPRNLKGLIGKIEKLRPTLFPAVPALFEGINRFPGIDRRDLSSIRGCFSGSAPLSLEVMSRFEALTGARITEGFGLTESSPVTHVNPLFGLRKEGSIGVPMPGTDARVVDLETGLVDLPVGEPGELIIRGPQVMKEYWNQPEETAIALRDGWLYTGDIATMDQDGYFFIVGRKKEMIIAGGYNIYPREIDEVLYMHPEIQEAAVVGMPDQHRGETVWAFVVLKPGATLTAESVERWCAKYLARYKIPRRVIFRDSLPRTTVGKVLRRELKEIGLEMMKSEQ